MKMVMHFGLHFLSPRHPKWTQHGSKNEREWYPKARKWFPRGCSKKVQQKCTSRAAGQYNKNLPVVLLKNIPGWGKGHPTCMRDTSLVPKGTVAENEVIDEYCKVFVFVLPLLAFATLVAITGHQWQSVNASPALHLPNCAPYSCICFPRPLNDSLMVIKLQLWAINGHELIDDLIMNRLIHCWYKLTD